MPHPFRLTVTNERTGESSVVTGKIPDPDWELLLAFLAEAEHLRRTRLIAQGTSVKYEFSWDREKGQQHKATLPPEDDVSAFLHRLRPFVLERERFFLPKILNVLRRLIPNPQVQSIFDLQTQRFFGRDASGFTIMVGELALTSDDTVLKWLNAVEYHRDEDKQGELKTAAEAIPTESQRAIFLSAMIDKAKSILTVAGIVEGLRDRGGKQTVVDGKQ